MDFALIMQIGLGIIKALPTIEAGVTAAQGLVGHIHSLSDAETAAGVVAQHLPQMIDAIMANTGQAPTTVEPAPAA